MSTNETGQNNCDLEDEFLKTQSQCTIINNSSNSSYIIIIYN